MPKPSLTLDVVSADLADRLVKADPKRVAALASSTDLIAARLLRLREIFPKVLACTLSDAAYLSCVCRHPLSCQSMVAQLTPYACCVTLPAMLLPAPQANASALVGNRLSLLLDDDLDEVAAAAVTLKELLPNITVDKFVEYYPQVLDIDDFELALQVRHMKGRVMCVPYCT